MYEPAPNEGKLLTSSNLASSQAKTTRGSAIRYGSFYKVWVLFVGVHIIKALLLKVYIGTPDLWKLPERNIMSFLVGLKCRHSVEDPACLLFQNLKRCGAPAPGPFLELTLPADMCSRSEGSKRAAISGKPKRRRSYISNLVGHIT